MKKMLLISTALMFATLTAAWADVPQCSLLDESWCNANGNGMGYIPPGGSQYSEAAGFSEILKCPLGSMESGRAHIYFDAAEVKDDCDVGDVIFNDNNCYVNESEILRQGVKTPIAVVFDPINKLALELKSIPTELYKWQNEGNYSPFYDDYNKPKILSFGTQTRTSCTLNEQAQIDKNLCSAPDVDTGNNRCPRQYGCKVAGVSTKLPIFIDFVSSTPYLGGWQNTIAMAEGGKGSGFASGSTVAFPAADYCYSKNLSSNSMMSNSRATLNAQSGKVWFLPSAADLRTLAKACPRDYTNCVGQKIITINDTPNNNYNYARYVYGQSGQLWSSTQDYQSEATSGYDPIQEDFYYYAVAPKGIVSLDGCNGWNVNMEYSIKKRTEEFPVLCVYHYGDDWDMSRYSDLWSTQQQQDEPAADPGWNQQDAVAPR